MKHTRPGDSWSRIEIYVGRKKPHSFRYYKYDPETQNNEIMSWFEEIRTIICTEENRVQADQLPEFIHKTPWCARWILGKSESE